MQWEKHPYFTLSSLTHWKVLIWFIIMKLNSRYLFLGLKHFTEAFNKINWGNKHVNIKMKCCHVEHTAHWWDSTFSLSHYRNSVICLLPYDGFGTWCKTKKCNYTHPKKWSWIRDPAMVDVWVRKQHWAVEGSQKMAPGGFWPYV